MLKMLIKYVGTLTILVDYKKNAKLLSLRFLKLGIPKENLLTTLIMLLSPSVTAFESLSLT